MANSESSNAATAAVSAAAADATDVAAGAAAGSPAARSAGQRSGQAEQRSSATAADEAEDLIGIECAILTNTRYHEVREGFLDAVHRWLMFLIIVTGASAVTDIMPEKALVKEAFAALAVILAALDLAFDLSNRARAHNFMKRRYYELYADLLEAKRTAAETRACLQRFSAEEEPPFTVVLNSQWNATLDSVFGKGKGPLQRVEINCFHRLLMHFFRFPGTAR